VSGDNGPTGREWGELSKEVKEIRHDLRTCRQIATSQSEVLHDLEIEFRKEMQNLLHSVNTVRTKIYTTISVVGVLASMVAFGIALLMPLLTD